MNKQLECLQGKQYAQQQSSHTEPFNYKFF